MDSIRERIINVSDPNYSEKEEVLIDAVNGEELCPRCGCCGLAEATVWPDSIFAQAELIVSGKTPDERRLVCAGSCDKDGKHK